MILCVDDDPAVRKLYRRALENNHYRVTTASNGTEAWDAIQSHQVDLILTEYDMPLMNGLQLARHIRNHEMQQPIIIASASVQALLDENPSSVHLAAFLIKPFSVTELIAAVSRAFAQPPAEWATSIAKYSRNLVVPPAAPNKRRGFNE